ncbi:UDP-N-acetylmuramate dehydrogenase [Cytobacillus sp. FSL W7-1323]|uniref:UDP-N-acetylenolpyruvoylglucosamine reductase n=1 Tax=Cytobacillus kochii TaxID=859143 RepID=A0A248TN30_9BACI|nr:MULTISPECIES: UDP-N-acetylmuramate dehydrogenase [Cytobacillus]ASV69648.1 UDP-N-acetylenolpyruvoylglucosamine reductase [Cytobacillus kochii]MEA1852378.1 UDP-N-acetylmuramate dehydrogenase [Cytobacillus sp. OWB-43]
MNIKETLRQLLTNSDIYHQEPMSKHTYIQVGGEAEIYVQPRNTEDAQKVVKFAFDKKIPLTLLGKGANVIISDHGLPGIVLNLNHFNDISVNEKQITAGSGAEIIHVSRTAYEHGLDGLAFACGIPGSVGGAVFMNAGAYGGEISNVLTKVIALNTEGELLTLTPEDFDFAYRTSAFAKKKLIVLEATFTLQKGNKADIKAKMDEFTFARESKQPLEYPSCGSVFKRPPGYFAGKLIQDSGLQGLTVGGAQVSTKHAGFMVNMNEATASDYIQLIHLVQEKVFANFGVKLEREVQILGDYEENERGKNHE